MNPNTYEKRKKMEAQYRAKIKNLENRLENMKFLHNKRYNELRDLRKKIVDVSKKAEQDGKLTDELMSLSISASFVG